MLYFKTAGESHGKCLFAIIEGFPSGISIDESIINKELKRRQGGLGRGGRMQIEEDCVEVLSGIRKNITIGSPICLMIKNRDYKINELPEVTKPRPVHADLAGTIKYGQKSARDILERASARETAARVAVGAVVKILLTQFNIEVFSYVKGIGGINSGKIIRDMDVARKNREISQMYCVDGDIEPKIIERIKQTTENKAIRRGFKRLTNNAGGIEGGISNGEPIIARAFMKPIPTLKKPLRSVDLITKEAIVATYERSDVCAVPAASVVCEAMIAYEITRAFLEKFGGDSITEIKRNYDGYKSNLTI